VSGNVTARARYDYLPFGEEIGSDQGSRSLVTGYVTSDKTRQKFTQKGRDTESGLDYFGARYCSSPQGRFTSVDAGRLNKRHLANPQKWNRYPYTINNPLKYIDPNGLEELIVIVNIFIPQSSTGPFKGDGRNAGENGTYRTHQRIVIETDPSKNGGNPLVGKPERDTGVSKGILPQGTANPSFGGVVYVPKEDKASGNSLGVDVTRNESGVVNVHAHGNENNPLVPSPGITYNFDIKVNSEGPQGSAEVTVTGKHDRFPGYEIIVQRPEAENNAPQVVYDFDPRKNGNTPMSLFPFTPKEYPNKTTSIPPKPE
jgi:RHS repeat-associated protein